MKKQVYLAGGCFWGTQKYLQSLKGVEETEVGYANGNIQNPSYEQICSKDTGFAETVKVVFDNEIISLGFILKMYFETIDPTSINKQGGDSGSQYRTGIYYVEDEDIEIIRTEIAILQAKTIKKVVIEVLPLDNYYKAEEYHQKYLDKNPNGYCHISTASITSAKNAVDNELISWKKTKF